MLIVIANQTGSVVLVLKHLGSYRILKFSFVNFVPFISAFIVASTPGQSL
jgi:hypothetical protein